ncbi:MAG: dTDP-glucose 4,6-dehydratase [Clostridiales bacterium]|jgi:dTDP-glucose 4,6-dehydratase|nr:dTDP-glucose 4,6-dehydratase [Eubacteriales bacterium]MDH7567681.1 dTDP-glucose 4,6-dehydratase [Clostridiales bacterium]
MKVILVTGGAGFIGSNFIKYFLKRNKNYIVVNMDKLTYAGNLNNLKELESSPRYHFVKGDICNNELVNYVLKKYRPCYIINFAAESHVDRSIDHPFTAADTNIIGTLTLLEGARFIWSKPGTAGNRFIQISTDEVYGSINNDTDYFTEESSLMPNSPYSASKAGADLLVRAFSKTYGVPAIITRSCNNYGPYQNIEKFIPTCITHALQDKPIPIYGDGENKREWIHVLDHCTGIIRALFYGKPGEIYNIGSGEEISNIELAKHILKYLNKPESALKMVSDRPGHDRRYAMNSYKARSNLNWSCKYSFSDGLKETIQWYKSNRSWRE